MLTAVLVPNPFLNPVVMRLAGPVTLITIIALCAALGIVILQKIRRLTPQRQRLAWATFVAFAVAMVTTVTVEAQVYLPPYVCCPAYVIYFLCIPICL